MLGAPPQNLWFHNLWYVLVNLTTRKIHLVIAKYDLTYDERYNDYVPNTATIKFKTMENETIFSYNDYLRFTYSDIIRFDPNSSFGRASSNDEFRFLQVNMTCSKDDVHYISWPSFQGNERNMPRTICDISTGMCYPVTPKVTNNKDLYDRKRKTVKFGEHEEWSQTIDTRGVKNFYNYPELKRNKCILLNQTISKEMPFETAFPNSRLLRQEDLELKEIKSSEITENDRILKHGKNGKCDVLSFRQPNLWEQFSSNVGTAMKGIFSK